MNQIRNTDDVIDSRNVIERIEELAEEEAGSEGLGYQELLELDALRKLAEEASDYAEDWQYGETLIRDSYFTEYAQQLADDLGYMQRMSEAQWPFTCIDWEQAARELKYDYSSVDFDGVTYWIR